jgi:RNA ligase
VEAHRALPRKEFAEKVMATIDSRLRGLAFAALDGKDPRAGLHKIIEGAAMTETRVEAVRDLFGMAWSIADLNMPDLDG